MHGRESTHTRRLFLPGREMRSDVQQSVHIKLLGACAVLLRHGRWSCARCWRGAQVGALNILNILNIQNILNILGLAYIITACKPRC